VTDRGKEDIIWRGIIRQNIMMSDYRIFFLPVDIALG